jgi:hypothetical protein
VRQPCIFPADSGPVQDRLFPKERLTVADLLRRQQDVVEMERAIVRTNMERHNVEVFARSAAQMPTRYPS